MPSGAGASSVQLEFEVSFTGHLLDVKSWLMSKASSRQGAAESHKKQDCILFRAGGLMGSFSIGDNSFFYHCSIVHLL